MTCREVPLSTRINLRGFGKKLLLVESATLKPKEGLCTDGVFILSGEGLLVLPCSLIQPKGKYVK